MALVVDKHWEGQRHIKPEDGREDKVMGTARGAEEFRLGEWWFNVPLST